MALSENQEFRLCFPVDWRRASRSDPSSLFCAKGLLMPRA